MIDPGLLGVIVGAVIAGTVTIGGELLRGRQAAALDRAKRDDDRRIDSVTFQRQTLLELQERLNDWMGVRTEVMQAVSQQVVQASKVTGTPDLDMQEQPIARRIIVLTERLLDDSLRQRLTDLRGTAARSDVRVAMGHHIETPDTIEQDWFELTSTAVDAQQHLGRVLRGLL